MKNSYRIQNLLAKWDSLTVQTSDLISAVYFNQITFLRKPNKKWRNMPVGSPTLLLSAFGNISSYCVINYQAGGKRVRRYQSRFLHDVLFSNIVSTDENPKVIQSHIARLGWQITFLCHSTRSCRPSRSRIMLPCSPFLGSARRVVRREIQDNRTGRLESPSN